MIDIFDLRRDFSLKTLDERDVLPEPMAQFELWFDEAVQSNVLEPNAMNLATVGKDMKPSSRTLLLKQIKSDGFVFFTNYESRKAQQMDENPYCAITFLWNELERQVRIEGRVEKISEKESDTYFKKRPKGSKLGAWASPQSMEVPDRKHIERLVTDFEYIFADMDIQRPVNWGGYIIKPTLVEFWQGRESRLHDRICYTLIDDNWRIVRLAP